MICHLSSNLAPRTIQHMTVHTSVKQLEAAGITIDVTAPIEQWLAREWLLTNGTGSYSSGTLAGVNTRRYHGLLVAAGVEGVAGHGGSVPLLHFEATKLRSAISLGEGRTEATARVIGIVLPLTMGVVITEAMVVVTVLAATAVPRSATTKALSTRRLGL